MANEHLERVPTSSGNRSTYTWSGWIKRNVIGDWARLFSTAGQTMLQFTGSNPPNQLRYFTQLSSSNFDLRSTALLRDVGSWINVVFSVDHTLQHSKNRARIYVNGAELDNYATDSSSNGSQNLETFFNSLTEHALLGRETVNAGENFRGEAFDIFWVDGQALTPDVFGFYKDGDGYQSSGTTVVTDFRSGQWSPRLPKSIKHTINRGGGFGVNGFYIPLNDSSNFGADFHCTPNSIIKLKGEDEPQPRNGSPTTSDSYASQLRSDPFAANLELAIPGIGDGLGSGFGDYSHLIKGSGSAKTVTTSGSPAHRTGNSYYDSVIEFDGSDDKLSFDNMVSNPGTSDFTYEFWTAPDDWSGTYVGLISLTAPTGVKRFETAIQSNTLQVYTDTGSWRDTGFEFPKGQWTHIAFERYNGFLTMYVNGVAKWVVTNTRNYDEAFSSKQQFGKHGSGHGDYDGLLQDLRFYTGVAKYKGGFDVPKPYAPQSIAARRATVDTCKNNFVTMNPLNKSGCTLSNGNLTTADATSSGGQIYSTMGSNTGKWYYEAHVTAVGGPNAQIIGIQPLIKVATNGQNRTGYRSSGDVYSDSGTVQSGTSYTTGDIIGVAWDADNKQLWFAKNGSWVYSGDPANGTNPAVTYTNTETQGPSVQYDNGAVSQVTNFNFGQNPTLSGQVTAGTFTDSNGIGLFKYEPPTGFLALCDDNLPTPTVADPGEHFKCVLWTGDGNNSHPITKVGFKPDLVWIKSRSFANNHHLFDVIRGPNNILRSSSFDAESNPGQVMSTFDSDGFTVGEDGGNNATNDDGSTFVGWCWKAGGAPVSNNNGTITSQVSANQTAGFSIVSYTGNLTDNATVGHGLLKAPDFLIVKNRDLGVAWGIWHSSMATGEVLRFTTTGAQVPGTAYFQDENNTSSVFALGTNDETNENNDNFIAYCWHAVEFYSKFGSYTGNNNVDGPFAYCGFKPAWLIIKSTGSSNNGNWVIYDSSRSSENVNGLRLGANLSDGENENNTNLGMDSSVGVDFLSNGFKIRTTGPNHNEDGTKYIFAAFAESPFQTANAK